MEYDTEYTTGEFICPYCGYKDTDIGEFGEGEYEIDCGECGKEITLSVQVSYYYSTFKSNPV
jgi:transcription elongation factor Elf1